MPSRSSRYRAELMSRFPHFHNRSTRMIVRAASLLPAMRLREPPFARPGLLHRFAWQAIYALQGSGGRYSGGPALCGRKRP